MRIAFEVTVSHFSRNFTFSAPTFAALRTLCVSSVYSVSTCNTFTLFLEVSSPNFNPERNVFKSAHMFFMIKELLFSNLITSCSCPCLERSNCAEAGANLLFANQASALCRLATPDLIISEAILLSNRTAKSSLFSEGAHMAQTGCVYLQSDVKNVPINNRRIVLSLGRLPPPNRLLADCRKQTSSTTREATR